MKLPNAHLATVPKEKITHYLLDPAHPVGASKAFFFPTFGFNVIEWRTLAGALLEHARNNEIVSLEETPYGTRYVVDGPLMAPDGAILNIRTAWYIDSLGHAPRFVTAHPLPKL